MTIQAYNYNPGRNQAVPNQVNFKGWSAGEKNIVKEYVENQIKWIGKKSMFFDKTKGEAQNQIGTAVFTTTLAPAVIALNPLSNQDKDTKTYSALRQPISAIIGLSIGLGMTVSFDKWLLKIAKGGHVPATDLRIMSLEGDVRKQYEKEKSALKTEAEKLKFEKDYPNFKKYMDAKNVQMAEEFAKKYVYSDPKDVLSKLQKGSKEYKKMEKDLANYNLSLIKVQDFMEKEFKLKFIKSGDDKFINEKSYKEFLEKTKAIGFLKKLGLANDKVTEEDLRLFLLHKKERETAISQFNRLPKEKKTPNALRTLMKEIKEEGKLASTNIQFRMGNVKDDRLTLGQFLEAMGIEKEFKVAIDSSLKGEIKNLNLKDSLLENSSNSIKDFILGFKRKVRMLKYKENGELKNAVYQKPIEHFANRIAVNKGLKAVKDFSHHNNYISILSNIIFTGISCTVLNWAYPRIMDALFPNLSKNKNKGGKK